MLFGDQILNPSLCSLGDQNFGILRCVLWGSEILNPFLCCLGNWKFWISRQEIPRIFWFFMHSLNITLKHYTAVERIFWFLANRESFQVSFNTSLRFSGYCKNHLWNKVAIMDFLLILPFYLRPILPSHFQRNFKACEVKISILRERFPFYTEEGAIF